MCVCVYVCVCVCVCVRIPIGLISTDRSTKDSHSAPLIICVKRYLCTAQRAAAQRLWLLSVERCTVTVIVFIPIGLKHTDRSKKALLIPPSAVTRASDAAAAAV